MDANAIAALIGAAALGFVVRVFNTVLEWLAKLLDVEPVEPIPTQHERSDSPPST